METIVIVAVISSVSALLVSVLTHIKYSSCKQGQFEITTKAQTPTRTSFQAERPEISAPIPNYKLVSEPIPIPKLEKKPLLSGF